MSEPSSLYMRVTLTQARLDAFKQSPINSPNYFPRAYSDWRSWLSSRKFYGEITDTDIACMNPSIDMGIPQAQTVGDYLSDLGQDLMAGQVSYDGPSQTWTLCVLEFSENYHDFILALSILRGIASYKDLPKDDFILIYPYLWENDPGAGANAYVPLTMGHSHIVSNVQDIPPDDIAEASQRIRSLVELLANKFNDL